MHPASMPGRLLLSSWRSGRLALSLLRRLRLDGSLLGLRQQRTCRAIAQALGELVREVRPEPAELAGEQPEPREGEA